MKKLIAAMLVLTLCATTAFAADVIPGQEIEIDAGHTAWGSEAPDNELSTTYYSIAGQTWESGKDTVGSVKIDNDRNAVILTLKKDYTSTREKTLKGTIKVRDKKKGRFLSIAIDLAVGFKQDTIDIESDGNIPTLVVDSETLYTVRASDKGYPYGSLLFQADIADVNVRVYDKEKLFLGYNREPDKETLLANAESDALMEFLSFESNPTFSGTATVSFYGLEKDYHIYELKNGRLTKTGAKWEDESDSFILKTRTLGSYVISDMTLRSATGATDNETDEDYPDTNPPTGANDVAGIAMALAIVSMVSAAAISLKKD